MDPKHRQKIFRQAAASGATAFVRTWCADVPQKTVDRAIQLTARNGHLECLKILTQHTTTPPNFALVQAARRGRTWCVKYLLKSANAQYCDGWAIRLAAKYGFDRCVEALFESSLECLHLRNNEAYRNALRSMNKKSMARLLDCGPNMITIVNEEMPDYWKNKLFAAVRQKKLQKAIEIITICHPTVKNDIDICLCICAMFNYHQCAEFFVQHGADHTRNNHNCLRQAAAKKHRSMFHYIWSFGNTETLTRDSRFMYSCFKNQWWDEAQMLLETVQCPNMRNGHLMCAAHLGHVEWVMKFLPLADPKANKSYALQYTCLSKKQEIFDILYDISDVDTALQEVYNDGTYTNEDREWFIHQVQRRQNEIQNTILRDAVGEAGVSTSHRKM